MENEGEKQNYTRIEKEDPENCFIYPKGSLEIENNTFGLNSIRGKVDNNIRLTEKCQKIKEKVDSYLIFIKNSLKKILLNRIVRFLYGTFLTLAWICLYVLSLEGCEKQQAECLTQQNHSKVIKIGKYILASAVCFLLLIILNKVRLVNKYFVLFSFSTMMYLFYYYDTGADFAHHGSYNRIFFYSFILIIFIIICFVVLSFYMIWKYPIRSITVIGLICYITYIKINEFIFTSCDYWNKGFKDSIIRNDLGYCKIYTPSKVCFLIISNNLFDISALRGLNCARDRNLFEEKNLLKSYLPSEFKNVKKIGFPRTETWNFFPESTLEYFNKNIFKNMINMDDIDIDNPDSEKNKVINNTEVYVDFEKEYPEVVIHLKKNQTLIEERKKNFEKRKNDTLFKNVIFIYLDALSRNHFRRKLKKTYAWLEKLYDNKLWNKNEVIEVEKNSINSNFSSYQFLKYHAVDYYTFANMIPGYFGVHKWDQKGTYFLFDYKKAGYITGQSTNVCEREGWDLEMAFEPYLNYTKYDHEFNAFYCDPNFSDPERPYQIFKGAYSIIRKCMYGKDSGEFQIEYAKQFFDTYKQQNKIYRMIFSDAHEGTLEVVKYLDDMLYDFFQYLLLNGHLDNSVLLVMSDHGISLPGPAYLVHAKDWYSEVFLPSLFLVIPRNHENFEQMDETLKKNENKWITSFDINALLRNFANKTNTYIEWGQSMISEEINEDYRSCGFYRMTAGYCLCNWEP